MSDCRSAHFTYCNLPVGLTIGNTQWGTGKKMGVKSSKTGFTNKNASFHPLLWKTQENIQIGHKKPPICL